MQSCPTLVGFIVIFLAPFLKADDLPHLLEKTHAGDPEAQFQLGQHYADGTGVAKNDALAANCFRLAACQGYPHAQYNLGQIYEEGRGVDQSDNEALLYYTLA